MPESIIFIIIYFDSNSHVFIWFKTTCSWQVQTCEKTRDLYWGNRSHNED